LRAADFSETSRVVTFLTPHRGRLACLAKGVRRPKNPLAAVLETFNRVELVYYWKEGRGMQPLGDAALLDAYAGIKADLEKTALAAFPLEIAYRVAHENEPSEPLYAALVCGLEGLAMWSGPAQVHACWQALQLLCAAGFAPSLDVCAATGRPIQIDRSGRSSALGFSFDGGVTCSPGHGDRPLSESGYAALRALVQTRERCPSVEGAEEIFPLIRPYAVRQLETDFRCFRVIDELLKGT